MWLLQLRCQCFLLEVVKAFANEYFHFVDSIQSILDHRFLLFFKVLEKGCLEHKFANKSKAYAQFSNLGFIFFTLSCAPLLKSLLTSVKFLVHLDVR